MTTRTPTREDVLLEELTRERLAHRATTLRARHLEQVNADLRRLVQMLIDRVGGGRPNAVNGPEDVW